MGTDLETDCEAYNKIIKTSIVRNEFLMYKSGALGPLNQAEIRQFALILKNIVLPGSNWSC